MENASKTQTVFLKERPSAGNYFVPLLAPAVQLLPEQQGTLEGVKQEKKAKLSVSQVIKLPSFLSCLYFSTFMW